ARPVHCATDGPPPNGLPARTTSRRRWHPRRPRSPVPVLSQQAHAIAKGAARGCQAAVDCVHLSPNILAFAVQDCRQNRFGLFRRCSPVAGGSFLELLEDAVLHIGKDQLRHDVLLSFPPAAPELSYPARQPRWVWRAPP